ncbi:MAG: hypothetical protein WCO93_06340 [bacterium]
MAEREVLLEQMLKVLRDIETNTCDKQFYPDNNILEKKIDKIIEINEKQLELLKIICGECSSKKEGKKKKKEKK